MSRLTGFYDNGTCSIQGISQSDTRILAKLKIFLNGKNIKYSIENETLLIKFLIDDEIFRMQEIAKILSFICKNFNCDIDMGDNISNSMNDIAKKLNQFNEDSRLLVDYRKNGIEKNQNFIKFCRLCDDTLVCKLRPYQYKASFYLTFANGGFDFSVPGSGKTIISYATYNYYKKNKICDSVLIIGPINSYNAWYDEYYTCFGKNPNFTSLANLSKNDTEIYLLSSESNHSEITFINIDKTWRMTKEIIKFINNKNMLLIVDEAHKEKNPYAEITKSVMEITKYVRKRIILTGTPMPNGYEDLFSLLKIYAPYQKLLQYNYPNLKKISKCGATQDQAKKIKNSIFPYYSRVSKKYLLQTKELLPAKYIYIKCQLSQEQKFIYDFLNKKAFEIDDDVDYAINQGLMKAILIRKMQVSANPGLLSKSIISSIDEYRNEYANEFTNNEILTKADNELNRLLANNQIATVVSKFDSNLLHTKKNNSAIELALNIINKGEKVIIWDIFVQNMNTLKQMLEKQISSKIEIINGSVNGEERQKALNNFKNGNSMILIANPATLAESVSLHRACQNAIYVNRNFNAAQFIQSKDRIHRINMPKNKTANYFFIINEDSIDQAISDKLSLKENRMLEILDSDELPIGGNEFDNDQFMSEEDVCQAFKK